MDVKIKLHHHARTNQFDEHHHCVNTTQWCKAVCGIERRSGTGKDEMDEERERERAGTQMSCDLCGKEQVLRREKLMRAPFIGARAKEGKKVAA